MPASARVTDADHPAAAAGAAGELDALVQNPIIPREFAGLLTVRRSFPADRLSGHYAGHLSTSQLTVGEADRPHLCPPFSRESYVDIDEPC